MFTGLVQGRGVIENVDRSERGARVTIHGPLASELKSGDSVAVNGVCLTAAEVAERSFAVEAMNETLARSSLADASAGQEVNLELALRTGDRLGGHIVQGHVDGVGTVLEVGEDGLARWLEVQADDDLLRYVVEKGSVAVDGVSLTVVDVRDASFTVSLIPETLERTTLGGAERGTKVNVEVDVLAKYVEKLAAGALSSLGAPPESRGQALR